MLKNGGARILTMRVLFSQNVNGHHPPYHKNDFKNCFFGGFSFIPTRLSGEEGYLKKKYLTKWRAKNEKKNPENDIFPIFPTLFCQL